MKHLARTTRSSGTIAVVLLLVSGLPIRMEAALVDLGGGLIYDDDRDVTWLQDANYAKTSGFHPTGEMSWDAATNWVSSLLYAGVGGWRLPSALNSDDSGPTIGGIHNPPVPNDSEMGHLYYIELGNEGFNSNPYNAGPFTNVSFGDQTTDWYWQAELNPGSPDTSVMIFRFANGYQDYDSRFADYHVWPVHDGRVTGPLLGDFNNNGTVENADLTLLLNNWSAAVPPTPTGWTGLPITAPAVDNDELTALLNNWGQSIGSGGQSADLRGVPEPTALVQVLLICGLWPLVRRQWAGPRSAYFA